MIEVGHLPAQDLVTIRVRGKLTSEDYDKAIPELEQAISAAEGPVNAVIMLDSLRGLELSALWKDLKFDVEHFGDFRRIAVIGQSMTEKIGAEASNLLTGAEVDFFPHDETDEAHRWATSS